MNNPNLNCIHFASRHLVATFVTLSLLLMLPSLSSAQDRGVVYPEAFYGGADLGVALTKPADDMCLGANLGLTAGYWVSSPLAIQLDMRGVLGIDNHLLASVSGELKWDLNHTFFHVYNEDYLKPIPFYALAGLGAMWDLGEDFDRSFSAMVGLQIPYRIKQKLNLTLNYKCYFLPKNFLGDRTVPIHLIGLGLVYNNHDDPFHRRPEYESRSVAEDWFIGFGIGPNYSAFDLLTNPHRGGLEMVGVAPEVMFGRNFSNFVSMRFRVTGLTGREQWDPVIDDFGQRYKFTMAQFDVMFNMSRLIRFRRGSKWNFMPYVGAGSIWRFDDKYFDMAADLGLFVRRYISKHSDVFADLRYVLVPAHIGGGAGPSGDSLGVALPSLTVGYIYNFGRSSTRYRLPYDCAY